MHSLQVLNNDAILLFTYKYEVAKVFLSIPRRLSDKKKATYFELLHHKISFDFFRWCLQYFCQFSSMQIVYSLITGVNGLQEKKTLGEVNLVMKTYSELFYHGDIFKQFHIFLHFPVWVVILNFFTLPFSIHIYLVISFKIHKQAWLSILNTSFLWALPQKYEWCILLLLITIILNILYMVLAVLLPFFLTEIMVYLIKWANGLGCKQLMYVHKNDTSIHPFIHTYIHTSNPPYVILPGSKNPHWKSNFLLIDSKHSYKLPAQI